MKKSKDEYLSSDSIDFSESEPEPTSDDDISDSLTEYDEDNEHDLPRKLYFFAKEQLNGKNFNPAIKAINTARDSIFQCDEKLKVLLEKSRKRSRNDNKVPPGSSSVKRDLLDDRFLLSLLCILMSKIYIQINHPEASVINELREALIWYPRSIEANYMLGVRMKGLCNSKEMINLEVYSRFYKASSLRVILLRECQVTDKDDEIFEILQDELQFSQLAEEQLILLLCQKGEFTEADNRLMSLGYSWRLSRSVYNYAENVSILGTEISSNKYLKIVDNILPNEMLTHLQFVFRSSSPFWSEHEYDNISNSSRKCGYFSYIFPLKQRRPICSIEQIIDFLLPYATKLFPAVSECNYAEWWVHNRSHCSGHQLHFDSDESALEKGLRPMHPIASMIIYVSGDVGGPTLVTNQILDGKLASFGWICDAITNRSVIFDGKYLHGVIPGLCPVENIQSRRLSFMVGFWRDIATTEKANYEPGNAQPFPVQNPSYSWTKEMNYNKKWVPFDNASCSNSVTPNYVSPVWEYIDTNKSSTTVIDPDYNSCFQGF